MSYAKFEFGMFRIKFTDPVENFLKVIDDSAIHFGCRETSLNLYFDGIEKRYIIDSRGSKRDLNMIWTCPKLD